MGISVKAVSVVETKVGIKARKDLAFAYASLDAKHFDNRVRKIIRDQEEASGTQNRLSEAMIKKAVSGLKAQAKEDAVLISAVATLALKADPAKTADYEKKKDTWMTAMAGVVGEIQRKAKERAEKAAQTRANKKE
tara:strand:+ start:407 stop:814 length:408 start_codon:yes stop_codon:yes gene_type:complete